jgi:DNA repair exonuclease SbcCD ATPase subunit
MISARDVLSDIERAILGVRRDEDRLTSMLSHSTAELDRLRTEKAEAFRALARLRLDELSRATVVDSLENAERKAMAVLERRRRKFDETREARAAAADVLAKVEEKRAAATETRDAAVAAVDELTDATEERLARDGAWQALSAAVAAARAQADAASGKAGQAESDRLVKGKPYEDDRLFMYLWRAGYGTSTYRAGPFARFFDAKVARLAGYEAARPNYYMLNEIPLRLREHADRLRDEVTAAEGRKAAYERQALEADGIVALEDAVDAAEAALAKIEAERSRVTADIAGMDGELAAFLEGTNDPALKGAVDEMAAALSHTDLVELWRKAEATPTPEDDRIVESLKRIERDGVRLNAETEELRQAALDMARKRTELERSREEFRRYGYDRPNGSFSNGSVIGSMIEGIVTGAITAAVLNGAFRSGYRGGERDRDGFGGGWHGGGWGGGSGGGGFSGGGGSGGGGFTTGGGF